MFLKGHKSQGQQASSRLFKALHTDRSIHGEQAKQIWSKPLVKGTPPSPRDSHTCTTVGTSLYIFGGTDGKNALQDLYILDTVTNTWTKPQVTGDHPAPREGHSAALIGVNLFIFGGCGKISFEAEEMYFNDLYILDTVAAKLHWTKAVTNGTPPVPRDSHTCSCWDNKLIVLGGEDASDSYLADVQILHTDVMEWKELQTTGQQLTPRAGHVTVSVGKHIFVFGGFTDDRILFDDLHMLNLETGVWSKVTTDGVGPSPRFSIAGDCIDAKSRGILAFIGGCNDNLEALDDIYYLDTEMQSEKIQDERHEKYSLRKELKRKRQESHPVTWKNPKLEKEVQLPPAVALKPLVSFNSAISAPMSATPGVGAASIKSSLYEFKPAEEKIFEAKITDVFHYGYTIESVIDGKLLRGLLFSYKPGFAHAVHAYLTRKKLLTDGNADNAKDDQKSNMEHLSVQNVSTVHDPSSYIVSGGESLVTPLTQPAYNTDQHQHYLPPQTQSQSQLCLQPPYHQQSHSLHQHQVPQLHQHASATHHVTQQDFLSDCQPLRVPISAPTHRVPLQDSRHFSEDRYGGVWVSPFEASPCQAPVQSAGEFAVHGSFPSSQGLPPPSSIASLHGEDACESVMQDPPSSQATSLPLSNASLHPALGEGHCPPSATSGVQLSAEQGMPTDQHI